MAGAGHHYAIVVDGGRQYRVSEGEVLDIDFRHLPAGTTTRPPPAFVQAAMAFAIASDASRSATAPKSVIGMSRSGNRGAEILARIAASSAGGSAAPAMEASPPASMAARNALEIMQPPDKEPVADTHPLAADCTPSRPPGPRAHTGFQSDLQKSVVR